MDGRNVYENLDAEMSVLGSAMINAKTLPVITEMASENFTDPKHRLIFQAIREIFLAHQPVDLVTMDQKLSASNRLEMCGGDAYLITLMQKVPSIVNFRAYIQIVQECTSRRRLRDIGLALVKGSENLEKTIDEVREKTAIDLREVRAGETVKLVTQADAIVQTYGKISDAQKKEGQPEKDRILTGIKRLDNLTGGLYGSKMIVIGARPSVGKSIFALQICMNAAKQGKKVLFVSLEMEADEIMEREFAAESLISLSEITSGSITVEGFVKLAESLGEMSQYPIYYCTEAFTVDQVRKAAFQMYENGGIDLICVDYLQLMSTPRSKSNRNEEVSEISRGLKSLAQEMKIPIIAISQLNRASEKSYGGKKMKRAPTMSEARESGSIEQDANIFILLHDPSLDELNSDDEKDTYKALKEKGMKLIHVNVDKNRQGRKAVFYLAFDGEHMRFLPIAKETPPDE